MKSRSPWIESHQDLARHPKTKRLARRLGISIPATIGHLHLLWWWALEYADDGSLAGYTAEDIAEAAMWEGEPEEFITTLVACGVNDGRGFLDRQDDGSLAIHEWMAYAGRLIRHRREAVRRTQEWREEHDVTHNKPITNAYVMAPPYPTTPNHTIPGTHLRGDADASPARDHSAQTTAESAGATRQDVADRAKAPRTRRQPKTQTSDTDAESTDGEHRAMWAVLSRELHIRIDANFPKEARARWNAAIKELREAGVKADDIPRLVRNYVARMGKLPATPHALVTHLPEVLDEMPSTNGKAVTVGFRPVVKAQKSVYADEEDDGA